MTKKIQRQLASSIRTPPTTGPIASAIAETAAQIPSARARLSAGKASAVSASESESSAAPPIPWITRAAISTPAEPAAPASSEPAAKIAIPITKTRRRPRRSPSRPAVTTAAVKVSR